jgi:hypothetical protein
MTGELVVGEQGGGTTFRMRVRRVPGQQERVEVFWALQMIVVPDTKGSLTCRCLQRILESGEKCSRKKVLDWSFKNSKKKELLQLNNKRQIIQFKSKQRICIA